MDEVAAKFSEGAQNVDTCYACQFYQADNGFVQGNADCDEYPESVGIQICPTYAKMACFEAASFHASYTGDVNEIKDEI